MEEDVKKPTNQPESSDTESNVSREDVSDEWMDEFSEAATDLSPSKGLDLQAETSVVEEAEGEEEEAPAEEEKVKDEIDIQIDLLEDTDWVVRREAVVTLGEMGDERCVDPLARALRDGDWQVRDAAIEALGMVGPPAVDVLIKRLREWEIRKSVIRALGKIKDERVLDPLMGQLRSDEFKDDATQALAEIGKPAVEKLVTGLADKDENVRKQCVLALGEIRDPEAIDPLVEKLQDKDWFTRLTAAAALEKIGDERGREAIKPLLKDPDLVVRMRVERILAAWKKRAAQA